MEQSFVSTSPLKDRGVRVGTLVRWDPVSKQGSGPMEIYSNEEILIGRSGKLCHYEIPNPYVSNTHVRIYTIIFDQDASHDVAPLVYAEDLSRNGTSLNTHHMGLGNGGFLLSHGDVLWITRDIAIRFSSTTYVEAECFNGIQSKEMEQFRQQYLVTPRVLGYGAFGRVHMTVKQSTGKQFACKMINLRAKIHGTEDYEEGESSKFFTASALPPTKAIEPRTAGFEKRKIQERLERNQREAEILAKLSHPNIIALEKVFRSDNTMYLITELLTGGDLFSFIKSKGGRLESPMAAAITRQVLLGVEYLHDQNIIHRDIKPDNILMTSLHDGFRVVLTDFGCAKMIDQNVTRTRTVVGTREYCAPEICKSNDRGYTKAIDLWSIGCLTMVLVAGYSPLDEGRPFSQADLDKLEAELISLDASKQTMDFIYRLLILDERKRMDVKQALQHDWLTDPKYKPDLDKLYQRAIQDWVPRRNEPTIVDLKVMNPRANFQLPVQNPVLETRPDLAFRPSSIDHVSESSLEAVPVKNGPPFESPTLSDVFHFDSYSRERKQPPASNHTQDHDDDVPNQHEKTSKKRHIFLSGCVSKSEQVDKKLEKQFLGTSFKMAEIRGQEDIRLNFPEMTSQARKSDVNLRDIELSLYDCKFSPSKPHRDNLPRASVLMCDRNKIQTQAEKCSEKKEEVYEVVHNHFTGKKRRYIYGRDVDSIVEIS